MTNRVGYWEHDGQPSELIDEGWDEKERKAVAEHLRNGRVKNHWKGYSPCRICLNRRNGSRCLTDGEWVWPEGLAHYVEKHNVRPPREFVHHALKKLEGAA